MTKGANAAARSAFFLSLVYGVQYLDQIMLGPFVQPIKAELHLTDTQVGLLTGVAFSLFYVVAGLPLARIADRYNRKYTVLGSLVIFSLATAACGLATGFMTLFLARVVVAIGEAGATPATVSMLADHFPPKRRHLIMSLYSCGGFATVGAGLLMIGLFGSHVSWRTVFTVACGVELILAASVMLGVREPARTIKHGPAEGSLKVVAKLFSVPSFLLVTVGMGMQITGSAAAMSWIPAFLARTHKFTQSEVILFLAFCWGVGAVLGTIVFGNITSRLRSVGGRWPMVVVGLLVLAYSSCYCTAFIVSSGTLSLVAIVSALFLLGGIRGPTFATVQDLVPYRYQATANATLTFVGYAIGGICGPVVTGVLSDFLHKSVGLDSLRYGLFIVIASSAILSAFCIALASLFIPGDMARVTRESGSVETAPVP